MDNLYSILNLYLNRETDTRKTVLNIKKLEEVIEFNFSMKENDEDKTSIVIPFDDYRYNITDIINKFKDDLLVIDEKYNSNDDNNCSYLVQLKNGRIISFDGFTMMELNSVRNVLYDITINKQELRVNSIDEEKKMVYKPRMQLQQAGFSSYATLFLVVIFFADILIISLWIFKLIMK